MPQLPFIDPAAQLPDDGASLLSAKEDKANKGVANGYAPLDATSKVPSANLPVIDVSGQITTHNSATTSVHGIANTANLVLTDDSRLADNRAPTSHKTSHATGGTDALTPSDIGASATGHTHSITDVTGLETAISGAGIKAGVQWTDRHTTSTGNPYLVGSIVYNAGRVYRCIAENDSMPPEQGGNPYWADLGVGYLLPNENPKIVGGSINTSRGSTEFGGAGGSITMVGSDNATSAGSINTSGGVGGDGGSIDTRGAGGAGGGSIITRGEGAGQGGTINTSGVAGVSDLNGGNINTSGGGSIDTSLGGGSISTRGKGAIGLGMAEANFPYGSTRTNILGNATSERTLNLPDASGNIEVAVDFNFIDVDALRQGASNAGDMYIASLDGYPPDYTKSNAPFGTFGTASTYFSWLITYNYQNSQDHRQTDPNPMFLSLPIGTTIRYRGRFFKVRSLDENFFTIDVPLAKHFNSTNGIQDYTYIPAPLTTSAINSSGSNNPAHVEQAGSHWWEEIKADGARPFKHGHSVTDIVGAVTTNDVRLTSSCNIILGGSSQSFGNGISPSEWAYGCFQNKAPLTISSGAWGNNRVRVDGNWKVIGITIHQVLPTAITASVSWSLRRWRPSQDGLTYYPMNECFEEVDGGSLANCINETALNFTAPKTQGLSIIHEKLGNSPLRPPILLNDGMEIALVLSLGSGSVPTTGTTHIMASLRCVPR